jgi:hypothetical protein
MRRNSSVRLCFHHTVHGYVLSHDYFSHLFFLSSCNHLLARHCTESENYPVEYYDNYKNNTLIFNYKNFVSIIISLKCLAKMKNKTA